MKKVEMMEAVVNKMTIDLDRMYEDMSEEQKEKARAAMSALLALRWDMVAEARSDA